MNLKYFFGYSCQSLCMRTKHAPIVSLSEINQKELLIYSYGVCSMRREYLVHIDSMIGFPRIGAYWACWSVRRK